MESAVSSLYVHVPFCVRKCRYCAFVSEAADGAKMDRYAGALAIELGALDGGRRLRTIYVGGGTPVLLEPRHWDRLVEALDRKGMIPAAEWTVEGNPGALDLAKARRLRAMGINRVSLGVQSLEDDVLGRLGRIHRAADARRAFDDLRRAGFENINIDLMFGVPGQTLEGWRRTVEEVLSWGSEHLACYEVIYEEDTPLFRDRAAGRIREDEDLACDMYDLLLDRAGAAGLSQYEVANWARGGGEGSGEFPDRACRHNINYWRGGSYYGAGPAACSHVEGVRKRNCRSLDRYCAALERGEQSVEEVDALEPLARAGEIAAFGLRMTSGWPYELFQQVTGYDLRAEWGAELERIEKLGYGKREADRFRLTRAGLRMADWVAEQMLRS